jgi:hypothetical protein
VPSIYLIHWFVTITSEKLVVDSEEAAFIATILLVVTDSSDLCLSGRLSLRRVAADPIPVRLVPEDAEAARVKPYVS